MAPSLERSEIRFSKLEGVKTVLTRRAFAQLGIGVGCTSLTLGARAASAPLPPPPKPPAGAQIVQLAAMERDSFCYLPLTVAERLGLFALEGLDVRIQEVNEHQQAMHLMRTGAVHAVSTRFGQLLLDHAKALHLDPRSRPDHVSISLQGRLPPLMFGVRSDAADAHGRVDWTARKIALPVLNSGSERLVSYVLRRHAETLGLNPTGSPEFVAMSSPSRLLAAVRAGEVDGVCYADPVATQLEKSGVIRTVADFRSVHGCETALGGPLPTGCLVTLEGIAKAKPAVCTALAAGMLRALRWIQTAGPSDIIRVVPEPYFQGDRALYLSAFIRSRQAWSTDGVMPINGPETAVRILAQGAPSLPLQRVALNTTFSNAFAQEAMRQVKT